MMNLLRAMLLALVVALLAAVPTGVQADPPQAKAFAVTLQANKVNAEVGKKVVLTGIARPAKKARWVSIQQLRGKSWITVGTRAVDPSTGAFKAKLAVNTIGATQYRAVVSQSGRLTIGISRAVRVVGWRWSYLADMDWHDGGWWYEDSVTIAGKTYPRSVYSRSDGSLGEINLDGYCTRLRGTGGLTNDSSTGSKSSLALIRDGNEFFAATFALGGARALDLDITGTLRLGLRQDEIEGDPYTAIGDAKVYCRR